MRNLSGIRKGGQDSKGHAALYALIGALLLPALIYTGCCDECDDTVVMIDNGPPSAPRGLYSVTGDEEVTLYWYENPEPDIAGYDVYWNDEETGYYDYLATTPPDQTWYVDYTIANGETRYYALIAFDTQGLESDWSYEVAFDTPRPEGFNLVLYDYLGQNSSLSGYDFSSLSGTAQAWDDPATDVYFDPSNGVNLLRARIGVDIQDYGLIDLIDVDWAPSDGWSPTQQAELIYGHSYIVRISDKAGGHNYAKIFVSSVSPSSVTLDWAYQTVVNNPELTPRGGASK
ncbi:MAG: hypothetical protein GTO51_01060 [Candidatus Latescibacteria bacterium]|nr:hypothetical protein [Candidatus Latescibacterota bacterium]NIM21588.1 hypothetical protein [Candidatus Latescibacterota bacterium]NIM64567.1 hypothetical protein [Candidatus Latescibacterota bacterium]NIO01082.1 hypothetical protein [Candidatus Latescibacterota bacterium]NIO27475.1 hypothetical protein [Candidatus Latescibacterota bacterium]